MATTTNCTICGKPVMIDREPVGDIVDLYKYEFNGSLDYIMLLHRKCALARHMKIQGDRVVAEGFEDTSPQEPEYCVKCGKRLERGYGKPPYLCSRCSHGSVKESQQVGTYQQDVDEAMPEQGEDMRETFMSDSEKTRENAPCTTCHGEGTYRPDGYHKDIPCYACKGTGIHPYKLAKVKEMSDAAVGISRSEGTMLKRFGSVVLEMVNEDDEAPTKTGKSGVKYYPVKKNGKTIYVTVPPNEEDEVDEHCGLPHEMKEHIVKHGSGYRLLSHKGKNLGDFPSHAAAAKHEGEVEYFKKHEEVEHPEDDEDSDAVRESTPPGKESWVRKNKARFKKEYGKERGTEVLYATAWRDKNKGK